MMLTKQYSFDDLTTEFALGSERSSSNVFYRQLIHYFNNFINITNLINPDGSANTQGIDDMLQQAYDRTPVFFKKLVENFQDPAGRCRTPVIIFPLQLSSKYTWETPRESPG